jgi:predicted acetyltransferase
MKLDLRWLGTTDAELDRVAETRMRCYAPAARDLPRYLEGIRLDPRPKAGDFLIAMDGAEAVGTSTVMDFRMWVRGAALPCQGVAFVGTVRTRRRVARSPGSAGVASQLMHETLRLARERGQVLSALMPFRASYYEHFGYGVVERRCEWSVPLAVLPHGAFDGFRYATDADRPAIAACHQRAVQRGQCDIERAPARWEHFFRAGAEGFEIVDRPEENGPVRGYLMYQQYQKDGKDVIKVLAHFADDLGALQRQFHFFASLRDQYSSLVITLPADLPLHWLLKERQLPHRQVNHAYAEMKPITRMQVRVMDHARLIESLHLPKETKGKVSVAVAEPEGDVSRFQIEVSDGRATVKPAAEAEVECAAPIWAAIVLGELPARQAVEMGLVKCRDGAAIEILTAFAAGPVPFCEEYF